jgi:hypothetical protein
MRWRPRLLDLSGQCHEHSAALQSTSWDPVKSYGAKKTPRSVGQPTKAFQVWNQTESDRARFPVSCDKRSKLTAVQVVQAVIFVRHALVVVVARRCRNGANSEAVCTEDHRFRSVGWKMSWRAAGPREQFVPTARMPRAKPAPHLKIRCRQTLSG